MGPVGKLKKRVKPAAPLEVSKPKKPRNEKSLTSPACAGPAKEDVSTSSSSDGEDIPEPNPEVSSDVVDEEKSEAVETIKEGTFADLGLHEELVKVCDLMGWKVPSPIQREAIPHALEGRDLIGLAVTGSGKTAAFVLPILHHMLHHRTHPFYALCLTPTRELAHQIAEQFSVLGKAFALTIVTLIGGGNHTMEVKMLARAPQVIVATPGRLVDHISNTQGFTLSNLKFLVLDEADRLLTLDFEEELRQIIKASSTSRQTFLFSATMTSRVSKLQKLSLQDPVKVSVSEKTQTAENLTQYMALVPPTEKFPYTATLVHRLAAYRMIIFCNTCKIANVLCAFLKKLGLKAVCLSGDMHQQFRLGAIRQFKSNDKNILVTTEVGSRGLDLPLVGYVINFDVPSNYRDYIHRVGRTARGSNKGVSYTLVNQYDVADLVKIEAKTKVPMMPFNEIKPIDYANVNFAEAKSAAEKEYEEAVKKKIFRKKGKSAPK